MAKRRTVRAERRAKKKAEKLATMDKPKGQSRYALKAKGQREPGPAQSRPSWFVREGWHLHAEKLLAAERAQRAVLMVRAQGLAA